MKKYLIYFFLCIQQFTVVYAQVDKTFWFAVPEVTQLHADRPIVLQLASAEKDTKITISQPANLNFKPLILTVKANQLQSVDLTEFIDELENSEPDKITNKGLLIEASEEITAYYEVQGSSSGNVTNTDIFALKGRNALGTEFYLPFQDQKSNNYQHYEKDGWSAADIVATENDTKITITLTKDAVGHLANIPFTITLNKGQTYSLRAASQMASERMVGTYISATKPIAITIKDDSVVDNQNVTYPAADLIGDQLIPLNIIGTQYILGDGTVYMLATEDNTSITIAGNSQPAIKKGEQISVQLSEKAVFIEASAPIYVLHVIEKSGEYGGAIVPPIQCTGSKKVSFIRDENAGFELTILVKKGGENSFFVNGKQSTNLVAGAFEVVPNTNGEWLYSSRDLTELKSGVNTIENKTREFHLGIKEKTFGGSLYGYFSNFGNLDLGVDVNVCQGEDVKLSAGEGRDTYLWSTGEKTATIEIPSTEIVKDLMVWVKITEGNCKAEDTVFVNIGEAVKGIELGENKELCQGETFLIELPETYFYEWNNGQKTANYEINTAGWHKVMAKSKDDCRTKDSIFVSFVALPILKLPKDTLICSNTTLELQLNNQQFYQWNTGETTSMVSFKDAGIYSVKAMTKTKDKICGTQEGQFSLDFWNVHTYNVLTPNGDGKNDVFLIDGIEKGDWQLAVYNRWGETVYYDNHYQNTWTGKNLNEGTYFFSLMEETQKAKCNEYKNWVQIIK